MKVILLQSVSHVGQKYDTVEVANGYALNYLIPQKLALAENSPEAQSLLANKEKVQKERELEMAERRNVLTELNEKSVTISHAANEQGILFASLDNVSIAKALSNSFGIDVRPDEIQIEEHIKHVGEHSIALIQGTEVVATVTLIVQAQ